MLWWYWRWHSTATFSFKDMCVAPSWSASSCLVMVTATSTKDSFRLGFRQSFAALTSPLPFSAPFSKCVLHVRGCICVPVQVQSARVYISASHCCKGFIAYASVIMRMGMSVSIRVGMSASLSIFVDVSVCAACTNAGVRVGMWQ